MALNYLCKRRDGRRCQTCGETKNLQAHHSSYLNKGGSFLGELDDLITVCGECHSRIHANRSIKDFAD